MDSLKEAGERYRRTPWEVRTSCVGTAVHVYPGRGMRARTGVYVHPPNFLERLLGITFDKKLERAAGAIQKVVDCLEEVRVKENELEDYLKTRRSAR